MPSKIIIKRERGTLANNRTRIPKSDVELWQNRVKSTIKWVSKHWNGWPSWRAAYLLDRAIHWGEAKNLTHDASDLEAEVSIPLIANHIRNLMPFLFSRKPIFYGTPHIDTPEAIQNALNKIAYLNAVWREHKMSKQARRAVLDAAIIGHGVVKTGWGASFDIPSTDDVPKKGNINYLDYLVEESPYIRRVNPFLFLFDRRAPDSDLESARWCCELVIQSFQDLIDNELYNEKVREDISVGKIPVMKVKEFKQHEHGGDDDSLDFLFKKPEDMDAEIESPDELCLVYSIYDRKFQNKFTLIPNYNDHILELVPFENNYDHLDNFPFVKVDFEEVPNDPYGTGHARYLADTQHQLNRNRTKIYSTTRMFNPKYVYKGSSELDNTQALKFQSDIPGEVINISVESSITPLEVPRVSEDLYKANQLIQSDYSELSGEDILARGGQLPSRTSAEEIRERRRLRGLRLETNVENCHEFVLAVAKQVSAHATKFVQQDKVVRAIGPGKFITRVSANAIKEEIDLDMEIIAKEVEAPDTKRNNLMQFFQVITNPNVYQLLQQSGVQVNIQKLFEMYLRTFGDSEMFNILPGIAALPDIQMQNVGNQPGAPPANPTTAQIQTDNVQPQSFAQGQNGGLQGMEGMEGMLQELLNPPGSITPSSF